MDNYNYLLYLSNPFDISQTPRLFLRQHDGMPQEITLGELFDVKDTIVGYHFEDLFSYYKGSTSVHSNSLIDVSLVARLLHGRKYEGRKKDEPWNIWNLFRSRFAEVEEIQTLWKYVFEGIRDIPNDNIQNCVVKFLELLQKLWIGLQKDLKEGGEEDRYYKIEKPVNEMFLKQQVKGISINQRVLLRRLDKIDEEMGLAGNILRDKWNIRDPFDSEEVQIALRKSGLACLAAQTEYSIFDSLLDLHAEHADLPMQLKIYRDCQKGKDILLRLGAVGSDKVYPIYNTLGTITARVIVESPSLQYLKRRQRDLIVADPDKVLFYPDYSQFEPGIMADDSGDNELIRGFNSGDLYKALSIELFGSEVHRESAKIIFLAFCYGMKSENMTKLAAEISKKNIKEVQDILDNFFGAYRALTSWKDQLRIELATSGRIGTRMGNFRYRTNSESVLSQSEERWVMSQRIQGTASLIFKSLIIKIFQNEPDVDFLLPMHDALLLQIPREGCDILKKRIQHIFIEEFKKECPRIEPRVVLSDFAEEADT